MWNRFEALAVSSEEDEALCLINNSLEQYYRTLKKLMGSHPNMWVFSQSLIGQEANARRMLMHNATGMEISLNLGRDECYKATMTSSLLLGRDSMISPPSSTCRPWRSC
jgi:hypothetical protein